MEHGWVYVLVNSSMPGLSKVGRTLRAPADRAAELSGVTGVPTPFVLVFEQAFADCRAAEAAIHLELDRRGLRAAANREFFRGSVSDIIRVVQATDAGDTYRSPLDPRIASALLAAGDRHLLGLGETLQDTGEALRCYKLAAARGAILAFERMGRLYVQLYASHQNRVGRRRALSPLKEGVRRGNYYCYCEMGALFAAERHLPNFAKSWDLFFARRRDAFLPEVELGPARFPSACGAYIAGCLDLGVSPAHRLEMRSAAEAIVSGRLVELDRVRHAGDARYQATRALRWVYLALMYEPAANLPSSLPTRAERRHWGPERESALA